MTWKDAFKLGVMIAVGGAIINMIMVLFFKVLCAFGGSEGTLL